MMYLQLNFPDPCIGSTAILLQNSLQQLHRRRFEHHAVELNVTSIAPAQKPSVSQSTRCAAKPRASSVSNMRFPSRGRPTFAPGQVPRQRFHGASAIVCLACTSRRRRSAVANVGLVYAIARR